MGSGSLMLLAGGLAFEPWPTFTYSSIAIMAWLVVVNTAFAFTLWNRSLRVLTSVQSSVIHTTMIVQVSILAWIFLGEALGPLDLVCLVLVLLGVLIVQAK
jgi:drug/metabolite transporter (DMT)-like permease